MRKEDDHITKNVMNMDVEDRGKRKKHRKWKDCVEGDDRGKNLTGI